MTAPAPATPEFSRPVRLDEIPARGLEIEIEAGPAERVALARRFGLQAIDRLAARVRLERVPGGRLVRLAADLEAEVIQTCVVTLDPVPSRVAAPFEVLYDPAAAPQPREVVVEGSETDIEPLEGDAIDVGEAVAEELALSLDPYPRAPGVAVEGGETPGEGAHRPFEILARFKAKH
jgi:uncharacterized metal-binding protein YceD (DUF177 family)